MEIQARFDLEEKVFIIENNKILQLPILGIRIEKGSASKSTQRSYSFCTRKAYDSLSEDKIIWRDEDEIYKTAEEIIEQFTDSSKTKNVN